MGGRRRRIIPLPLPQGSSSDGKTDRFSTFLNLRKNETAFWFSGSKRGGEETFCGWQKQSRRRRHKFCLEEEESVQRLLFLSFFAYSDPLLVSSLLSFCRISSMKAAYVALPPTLFPVYDLCTLAVYRVSTILS